VRTLSHGLDPPKGHSLKDWLRTTAHLADLLPTEVSVDRMLEAGGQGVVHLGRVDGVCAAVKVYYPGQLEQRVQREIAALQSVSCPSIVRLLWHGAVEVQGQRLEVVATEYVEGVPLNRMLETRALNHDELGVLAFDVASAIEAMWARRIVHRDVKPSNVLMRPNGRACVIDLGLARHLDETSLTDSGTTWGTRGYMSPEQWRCTKSLSCHSDMFSLGILLVEASAARHPSARDQRQLLAMALHETLPAEAAHWGHAGLLKQMLSPTAHRRPLPGQVREELAQYQST